MRWPGAGRKAAHRRTQSYESDISLDPEDDLPPPSRTPLPKGQIFVLMTMRLTEPLCFFVVYPLLPSLVKDFGVAKTEEQVGYYAGLVESLFAVAQFATILQWGRLSDRIGRKPVLIIGLFGVTASMFAFGLSRTFAGIIVSRCLSGALNGNVAVVKSMIGELSDDTNQARAYSFLPLVVGIGGTLGPLIGGFTSEPVKQYPNIFGSWTLFATYPYLLPCAIGGSLAFLGAVLGVCVLKETLKRPSAAHKEGEAGQPLLSEPMSPVADETPAVDVAPRMTPLRELLTTRMLRVIASYMLLVLCSNAFMSVVPLFCYTPIEFGGVSFSQNQIGIVLAIRGLSAIALQLLVFPPLCNRLGPAATFKLLVSLYPVIFALFPLVGQAARAGYPALVWVGLCAAMLMWATANMAFAANMLIVTNSAPSRADLGTLHGLTQSSVSLTRSVVPFAASSLFALSVDKQVLSGYLIYVILVAVGGIGAVVAIGLRDTVPAWRQQVPKERGKAGARATA